MLLYRAQYNHYRSPINIDCVFRNAKKYTIFSIYYKKIVNNLSLPYSLDMIFLIIYKVFIGSWWNCHKHCLVFFHVEVTIFNPFTTSIVHGRHLLDYLCVRVSFVDDIRMICCVYGCRPTTTCWVWLFFKFITMS